jgi:creatinine amidohydrolase
MPILPAPLADLLQTQALPAPRRLDEQSWAGVGEVVADPNAVLMLPLGATEQHGPHLPINTDTVIARAICDYASARSGAWVAPAHAYTVSAGHTGKWPGTFSLSHQTFITAMGEWTDWAVSMGWRRVLWINAHYGNDASLRVALDIARVKHLGALQIGLITTFRLTDEIADYFSSDAADLHANQAETDLMRFLAPESVKMSVVEDDPDRTVGTVFSYPVAQTSLNGVTGAPSQGTAERGRSLLVEMGEALAAQVEVAKTETPPLPASEWAQVRTPLG